MTTTYVYTQFPAEIAQALRCSLSTAERLVDTALTSTHPIALPTSAAAQQQQTCGETEPVG